MMKKTITLTYLFLVVISFGFAQDKHVAKQKIQWLDFETAVAKQKEIPKPIFIDMYTDWCGWCKKLDATTFSNPGIVHYINDNFYPVKFNAETRDTIEYNGKTYVNNSTGRRPTHQLARELLDNRASYPSMVYIDEKGNKNKTAGYLDAKSIEPILVFFAERVYNTTNYGNYHKAFRTLYMPQDTAEKNDVSGTVNWMPLEEALRAQAVQPKKVLILFWSKYYQNVSSYLMKDVILKNPVLANYLNENYYCVEFESTSTDTISLFDKTFINEQKQPGYPHQFAITMLSGKLTYPAILFFNEKNEILAPMRGFYSDYIMEAYLNYINDNLYKEGNWQEYYKNYKGKIPRPKTN